MTSGQRNALVGVAAAGAAALAYATAIEPYDIELVRLEILCPRLPALFDGVTVLQISDLHMRQFGRRERAVAQMASELDPDIVALTGDMAHTNSGVRAFFEMAPMLCAKLGIFAIFGNSEHKNGIISQDFAALLSDVGIQPLLNRNAQITRDGDTIWVCGVDDPVSENERLDVALDNVPSDAFKLLLMHTPDLIAEAAFHSVDLVLSGHTHGGQVRFPLIGAPFTRSLLGPRMSSGYYDAKALRLIVGSRVGATRLYVSRGVGASGLALRFLCRPEITLITLRSIS